MVLAYGLEDLLLLVGVLRPGAKPLRNLYLTPKPLQLSPREEHLLQDGPVRSQSMRRWEHS